MKKALIITYYWPPAGGPAVQRWVKFVKYLPEFGWKPIVYVPENPDYPVLDHSFSSDLPGDLEVLKKSIWEPYDAYRKFLGLGKHEKFNQGGFIQEKQTSKLKDKIANFIRSNFFIPDARRFWIGPSVKYLKKHIRDNPVDLIVTTGPPHSLHLIGMKLKRELNIPWLADFRDPWTRIYYYDDLLLTNVADKQHRRLERKVLQNADQVVTVGWTIADELKELGAKKVEVITNGYDEAEFSDDKLDAEHEMNNNNKPSGDKLIDEASYYDKFTIVHTGNISRTKNHQFFWKAVGELIREKPDFGDKLKIILAGKLDHSVHDAIINNGLEAYTEKAGFVEHSRVIKMQQDARVLLLMVSNTNRAKGAVTGKIFEYLAAKRPIIAIVPPDSDAARIMNETQSGKICDFDNKELLKDILFEYFQDFKQNKLDIQSNDLVSQYSRENLTDKLAHILNGMIS